MTPGEIRACVARHVANVATRDAAVLAADHAEDGIVESPSFGMLRGRPAIAQGYERMFAAFPDLAFTVESVVAEGDQAAVAIRLVGTHRGEFLGMPATGKQVEARAVFLQRLKQSQIVHERRIHDFSGLLIKLGVLRVKPG